MERMKETIGQMRADTGRQGQIYPKTSRRAVGDLCILNYLLGCFVESGGSRPKWIWVDQQESNPENV